MASRNLGDLIPEVRQKVNLVLNDCETQGVDVLIYCTLRPLEEQARLYRQSRSWEEIRAKMLKLEERGFGFLADIIGLVGPCSGPHVTDAAPGESWHGFKEAFDGVPMIGGTPAWKYEDAPEAWDVYGQACRDADLNWAGDWNSFKELFHAQLREGSNPLKIYNAVEVKIILERNGLIKGD